MSLDITSCDPWGNVTPGAMWPQLRTSALYLVPSGHHWGSQISGPVSFKPLKWSEDPRFRASDWSASGRTVDLRRGRLLYVVPMAEQVDLRVWETGEVKRVSACIRCHWHDSLTSRENEVPFILETPPHSFFPLLKDNLCWECGMLLSVFVFFALTFIYICAKYIILIFLFENLYKYNLNVMQISIFVFNSTIYFWSIQNDTYRFNHFPLLCCGIFCYVNTLNIFLT